MSTEQTADIGWAILELMGHRKLAGFVSDDQGLVRIDVYTDDPEEARVGGPTQRTGAEPIATQWYGRAAIYCITASTMDLCLKVAQSHQPAPVGRWELPAPEREEGEPDDADVEDDRAYTDEEMGAAY